MSPKNDHLHAVLKTYYYFKVGGFPIANFLRLFMQFSPKNFCFTKRIIFLAVGVTKIFDHQALYCGPIAVFVRLR